MLRIAAAALIAIATAICLSPPVASSNDSKPAATKSKTNPASKQTAAKKSPAKPVATAARDKDLDKTARSRLESVPSRRDELRGIWIPMDGPRDWDELIRKLKAAGLNAVFVRVAQGGKAIYPSKILPQDQWAAESGEDELAKGIEAAHRHGIQFHAWKVCFPMGSARARPPGSKAAEFYDRMEKDDRLLRDADGKQYSWLNPSDPRNQDLEVQVASEIVKKYAVDGYHLDYIRYPASQPEPGFDSHFGDVSRHEFEKSLGHAVPNWPTDVMTGSLKMRYERWEQDNISRVVGRIHAEMKLRRPGTLLSAAVWRKIHVYRGRIKQDWPLWGRDGLLDFIVLMAYEAELDNFRSVVERDFSTVAGQVPFVVGIGSYLIHSPEAVVNEVQAAREIGADGFVLFSVNDPTDDKTKVYHKGLVDRQLDALALGATKSPAAPALGGPRLEFHAPPESIARRYNKAFAIESGQPASVAVRLPKSAASAPVQLSIAIEDLNGRRQAEPKSVTLKPGGELAVPLPTASVTVRPVVRGTLGSGKDAKPFVLRGPIIEPVSATDIAELRARELPPQPAGSAIKVGVYFNGLGSDGIFDALADAKGFSPVRVYRLEASHLARLDVLVLPHIYDLLDMNEHVAKTLRTWVEGGGRLILTRDACGLRWHPRLFLEVGEGRGKLPVEVKSVQTAVALHGLAKGTKFDHECKDHVQLQLGAAGKPLVAETKSGRPVVAAGRIGKGLVILDGLVPGNDDESGAKTHSMQLLLALIQYRGG